MLVAKCGNTFKLRETREALRYYLYVERCIETRGNDSSQVITLKVYDNPQPSSVVGEGSETKWKWAKA